MIAATTSTGVTHLVPDDELGRFMAVNGVRGTDAPHAGGTAGAPLNERATNPTL